MLWLYYFQSQRFVNLAPIPVTLSQSSTCLTNDGRLLTEVRYVISGDGRALTAACDPHPTINSTMSDRQPDPRRQPPPKRPVP